MSRYDKRLWREIDTILFRDWDPIGIHGESDCEDEYEHYIAEIYGLITGCSDSFTLAQHLARIETENMGLNSPDREERCRRIAEQLLALRL